MNLTMLYKVDYSKEVIIVAEKDLNDEKDSVLHPFSLKDDILYIEIPLVNPPIKLWMRKDKID